FFSRRHPAPASLSSLSLHDALPIWLVFMSIPAALVQLPLGALWSILFFALLFLAAWTSAISLLEVLVAYGIDEWKLSRKVSTLLDRKSTRLNSSHVKISYAVFCLKK